MYIYPAKPACVCVCVCFIVSLAFDSLHDKSIAHANHGGNLLRTKFSERAFSRAVKNALNSDASLILY